LRPSARGGLLGLELQIDLVEGRERLADLDGLANFHQTLGDLAGNAKAQVTLDPGPDRATKLRSGVSAS